MKTALAISKLLFYLLMYAFACGIFMSVKSELIVISIGIIVAKSLVFFLKNKDDFPFVKTIIEKLE
ncbi:MAG: hypothetical protein GX802_00810 [Clostridiales bacterium]|jgi:hypothetical protein|nr:hypothetical protein [Clostridiales bacterium]